MAFRDLQNRKGVLSANNSLPKMLVLIAEAHADTRDLLKILLSLYNFEVVETETAQDALNLAESKHPNLIVMDVSLPSIDGIEATRRIRESDALRNVPIIITSAYAQPEFRIKAFAAGCDYYMVKPFDLDGLISVIEVLLGKCVSSFNQPYSRDKLMNSSSYPKQDRFFGVLELDADGTVLYSELEQDYTRKYMPDITGHNFFTEIAPFNNVEEFRYCIRGFNKSSRHTDSFNFVCQYADGPVPVRVVLTRVFDKSKSNSTALTLVQIRNI